jgi:MFS transporter, PAT family, beta-lactamase induction signal transducer AmpG
MRMGWLTAFRSRRMAVVFLLGFSSGLPLMLTGQTLQAWLTAEQLSLREIAAVSSVGLAYTFKFAWAPLLDRFRLPWLGRRRGWVLALQIALIGAIAAMGLLEPRQDLAAIAVLAVGIAVLSASQDVVLDAYLTDVLAPDERAAGSSASIIGYKIATVISSTVALVMADHVVWSAIWVTMAALLAIGIAGTVFADEPTAVARPPRSFAQSLYLPALDLWQRYRTGAIVIVLFTALYRFGDYFAQALVITFLKRGVGFDFTEIAAVYKLLGFVGIFVGGVAGGALVTRFGLRRSLLAFGALAATTHLLYIWLAVAGKSTAVFCIAVACDNTASAMSTVAFVAFLMSVCSPGVSATQFALLTSLASVGQRVFGPFADSVVDAIGWSGFFTVCAAAAIPGLTMAWLASRVVAGAPRSERIADGDGDGNGRR